MHVCLVYWVDGEIPRANERPWVFDSCSALKCPAFALQVQHLNTLPPLRLDNFLLPKQRLHKAEASSNLENMTDERFNIFLFIAKALFAILASHATVWPQALLLKDAIESDSNRPPLFFGFIRHAACD